MLQGVWDYRTTTPLERPEHLGTTAVVTGDAADALIEWRHRDNQAFQDQLLGADWSAHLDVRHGCVFRQRQHPTLGCVA